MHEADVIKKEKKRRSMDGLQREESIMDIRDKNRVCSKLPDMRALVY